MILSKLHKPELVLSLLAFMVAVFAQQDVIKKPFETWTREDAESILNSSPWAAHSELRLRFDKERQSAAGSYTPEAGVTDTSAKNAQTTVSSDFPVDFVFTARLRSARPIRQALSRLKQLQLDTKMSEKNRATLETQIKGLIECPACASNYVITLSSKSVNRPGSDAVYSTLKGGRLSDLQRYVFIANDRGERRPLVHFVPPKVPGDEAIFFFPRLDEKGAPLLTPDNKELVINLTDNRANAITNFKFDVSKLLLNSKVEF